MLGRRVAFSAIALVLTAITLTLVGVAQRAPDPPRRPGPLGAGVTQLPNGWRIAPEGRHSQIGDLPLNMVWSPDGRYLIVTNNGWSRPTLTVFDTATFEVRATVPVSHAWLGLAWHPDGKRLFSSGAAQNVINEFAWNGTVLKQAGEITIAPPVMQLTFETFKGSGFMGGIALTPDGSRLFATHVFGSGLSAIDVDKRTVLKTIDLPAEPYSTLVSADGRNVFVSIWGGAKILVFDAQTLEPRGEVAVGEHPNAMVQSKDGKRLFVACANTNAVWAISLESLRAVEQIGVALAPKAPPGTTPNALALSPDGKTLLVANADNNTIAVVDVDESVSKVEGFIPTGWYPTGVTFSPDAKQIYILSGKGLSPAANPRGPTPMSRGADGQYIAQLMQGTLSQVATPDAATLATLTKRVYDITAYSDAHRLAPADAPAASPIPRRVGDPSPITHVFYVIRENRTYDQILGDVSTGNGDPNLAIFGEAVTPNAHALARDFVLLDNFYVDAEVSYDGHAFSTGAYATDVVEKIWPTNYGSRGGIYLSEGEGPQRNPFGNLSAPPQGYLWDMAKKAGVSVRSYGEFAHIDPKTNKIVASVPGLEGLVHPDYSPWDLTIPDAKRLEIWLKEFEEFDRAGTVPRLSIVRLPNDHTAGTRPDAPTPRAMVAENDLAVGRFVEAVTKSRIWKESAIFILEDDAQNGPDHVDAHRSVAFVVSPFTKRRTVDSGLYSTTSVLRTIELILGLEPMTQYDAAARPLYDSFHADADVTPYVARPAQIDLTETNSPKAFGAEASLRMNMNEADVAPELELNDIVWRSVRGADSPMPPPRRAAFIRAAADDDDDRLGAQPAERRAKGDKDDDDDDVRPAPAKNVKGRPATVRER